MRCPQSGGGRDNGAAQTAGGAARVPAWHSQHDAGLLVVGPGAKADGRGARGALMRPIEH